MFSAYQTVIVTNAPRYPLTPSTVLAVDSFFACAAGTGGTGYATATTLDGIQLQTPPVANPCP